MFDYCTNVVHTLAAILVDPRFTNLFLRSPCDMKRLVIAVVPFRAAAHHYPFSRSWGGGGTRERRGKSQKKKKMASDQPSENKDFGAARREM